MDYKWDDAGANVTRIDVRGLKCPLPVLKAAKRIKSLPVGETLEVWTTDPMAAIDIPHFCSEGGHDLLEQIEEAGYSRFVIRKTG